MKQQPLLLAKQLVPSCMRGIAGRHGNISWEDKTQGEVADPSHILEHLDDRYIRVVIFTALTIIRVSSAISRRLLAAEHQCRKIVVEHLSLGTYQPVPLEVSLCISGFILYLGSWPLLSDSSTCCRLALSQRSGLGRSLRVITILIQLVKSSWAISSLGIGSMRVIVGVVFIVYLVLVVGECQVDRNGNTQPCIAIQSSHRILQRL